MKRLSKQELELLTFPDATVTSFQVDIANKVFRCTTNISHIGGDINVMYGETSLIISNWSQISIQEWHGESFLDISNKLEGSELKDICENNFGTETILKGFTVGTDFWTEYKFTNGNIVVEVEPFNDDVL